MMLKYTQSLRIFRRRNLLVIICIHFSHIQSRFLRHRKRRNEILIGNAYPRSIFIQSVLILIIYVFTNRALLLSLIELRYAAISYLLSESIKTTLKTFRLKSRNYFKDFASNRMLTKRVSFL